MSVYNVNNFINISSSLSKDISDRCYKHYKKKKTPTKIHRTKTAGASFKR